MPDDMGEKTEQPTAKRLSEMRQKGQVPKSADLAAVAGLFAAAGVAAWLGPGWADRIALMMRRTLSMELSGASYSREALVTDIAWSMGEAVTIVAPAMAIFVIVGLAMQYAQVGILLTAKPLMPKGSRINPIGGTKRIVGKRNAGKQALNILKLCVIVLVGVLVMRRLMPSLVSLSLLELPAAAAELARAAAELVAWLLLLLFGIGVLALFWQRWNHKNENKMTKQEVQDERRSMDGDPLVKQRQLQIMREATRQRINEAVPKADVIVTNPTHYAVALQYDSESMAAPVLIAKGADYLAWRIRHVARLHDVPIVERPPLARALYGGIEIGEPVRPEHYEAVAEILAYVYRLRQEAAA